MVEKKRKEKSTTLKEKLTLDDINFLFTPSSLFSQCFAPKHHQKKKPNPEHDNNKISLPASLFKPLFILEQKQLQKQNLIISAIRFRCQESICASIHRLYSVSCFVFVSSFSLFLLQTCPSLGVANGQCPILMILYLYFNRWPLSMTLSTFAAVNKFSCFITCQLYTS